MVSVGVHEAKTQLSKLLARVAAGEEILILRSGKPIARLAPLAGEGGIRNIGIDKGSFQVPDDFNDPLPSDLMQQFES